MTFHGRVLKSHPATLWMEEKFAHHEGFRVILMEVKATSPAVEVSSFFAVALTANDEVNYLFIKKVKEEIKEIFLMGALYGKI